MADNWDVMAPVPDSKGINCRGGVMGDHLYAFAVGASANTIRVYEYTVGTDSWAHLSDSSAQSAHSLPGLDIFAIGSKWHFGNFAEGSKSAGSAFHIVYDVDTDAWSSGYAMSAHWDVDLELSERAIGVAQGKAWHFGGISGPDQAPWPNAEVYDPDTDAYTIITQIPQYLSEPNGAPAYGRAGRNQFAVAVSFDRFVTFFRGLDFPIASDGGYRLQPRTYDVETDTYTDDLPEPTHAAHYAGMAGDGGGFLLDGGGRSTPGSSLTDDVESYQLGEDGAEGDVAWTTRAPHPQTGNGTHKLTFARLGPYFWTIGGFGMSGVDEPKTLCRYTPPFPLHDPDVTSEGWGILI